MKGVIGFLAFAILIVFILIMIFRVGGERQIAEPAKQLNTAAETDARFEYYEQGPIVAEEDRYAIKITITRGSRQVEVFRGYEGNVVASKSFDNNQEAFSNFLSGLDRAGYRLEGRTRFSSEAGLCPSGRRYVLTSNQFDEEFRRWTTSCQERGNFGGVFSTVRELYRDQIPEYGSFIRDTRRATGLSL